MTQSSYSPTPRIGFFIEDGEESSRTPGYFFRKPPTKPPTKPPSKPRIGFFIEDGVESSVTPGYFFKKATTKKGVAGQQRRVIPMPASAAKSTLMRAAQTSSKVAKKTRSVQNKMPILRQAIVLVPRRSQRLLVVE